MNEQSEALRLADELGIPHQCDFHIVCEAAAAELRRLHKVEAERNVYQEMIRDYEEDHYAVVYEKCAGDELHCSCVPHLRKHIQAITAQHNAAMELLRDMVATFKDVPTLVHNSFDEPPEPRTQWDYEACLILGHANTLINAATEEK